jgi:hypothetical protein
MLQTHLGRVRDGQERPSWALWANEQGMPSSEALRASLTSATPSGKGRMLLWRMRPTPSMRPRGY